MLTFAWIAFVSLCLIACAYFAGRYTARHAAAKGRSEWAWFFWGAVLCPLFPFPVVIVDLIPPKGRRVAIGC